MLSKTSQYALRTVVYLASRNESGTAPSPVPLAEIADALGVPSNYLSKVTHRLARVGVLESTRGPGGGFRLAISADDMPLARVTAPFEETGGPLPCLLKDRPCNPAEPCVAHDQWKEIAGRMLSFFEQTTVAELLAGAPDEAARI